MSGAYVGQELESEFGRIPPSFLPLGNRRLFQHQIDLIPKEDHVYISLPESFSISEIDQQWLENRQVKIISIPDSLNIGASLVAAINISGHSLNTTLHILYGDTLFQELPEGEDIVSVSTAKDSYNWAVLSNDGGDWLQNSSDLLNDESQKIIVGYFKFSQPRELVRYITKNEWNFITGLNNYHENVGLSTVESKGWLDFGHVNTYYHSKAEYTTQRAFNHLTVNEKWIEKTSSNIRKIIAEIYWFENLPLIMRGYIPQYLGSQNNNGKISYRLEYLCLTPLSDLVVFSKLPIKIWQKIFNSIFEFLNLCMEQNINECEPINDLDTLLNKKTNSRLSEFFISRNISVEDKWKYGDENISLEQILCDANKHLPNEMPLLGIMHGDFCFSNILYDFRANNIKIIDPRGMTFDGRKTLYGDIRYDIAKISHSIIGMYDFIIAGYYHVEIEERAIKLDIQEPNQHKELQQVFIELIRNKFGLTEKNIYAMQIHLFLSMLPLHADDRSRQDAFFVNAFRLHQILLSLEK